MRLPTQSKILRRSISARIPLQNESNWHRLIALNTSSSGGAANDFVDSLYQRALPNNAPVPLTEEGLSVSTDSSEDDWQSQTEIETALRQEFGENYGTVMRQMSVGAQYLFQGNEGHHALMVLTERMSSLGPKREALGVKFLADLAHLQSITRRMRSR